MNKTILLTGATGFLGGAIAVEAIRRGLGAQLLLLGRGESPRYAYARIIANLKLLGASDEEVGRIGLDQVLHCDLSELSGIATDRRLDTVSIVIHSAALATFSNHPSLEKINVDGTIGLAKLMDGRPALSRFIYIGTAMACGPNIAESHSVPEEIELPVDDEHLVPYTRSKALAETRLREEFPGLPLLMVRPSIIVGHTQLGCAPSQSIFWVFMVAQMLGAFTIELDEKIDVIPVDWAAQSIITLALKETLRHAVYHLSAGIESSASFREIDIAHAAARGIEPMGKSYERVTAAGLKKLLPRMKQSIPGCNDRLLLRALKLYGGFADLSYVFRNDNLMEEGIGASPRLTDYIARCADSTRHIPIAEQMKWDLK